MKLTEIIYFGFEASMLYAHLAAHKGFADHTIVVECPNTTTGIPKPCIFEETKDVFNDFDVEHIILPASTFPIATQTYNEFKHQDNNWKKLMHPYASLQGADWILHNDTDEILSEGNMFSFRAALMSAEPDIRSFNYHLDQRSPYINMRYGTFHVQRMQRAGAEFIYPKDFPRETFPDVNIHGPVPIGWHFTNCFSSAEEMYWKVKCRNWLVPEVSLKVCEEAMERGVGNIPEPRFDSIRRLLPETQTDWTNDLWALPTVMSLSPDMFPRFVP